MCEDIRMNAPINKDLIAANSDRCAQPPSERVEALKKAVQSETVIPPFLTGRLRRA